MFPSRLLFVQLIRLYSVLSPVGLSSNRAVIERLSPLRGTFGHARSQLLQSKITHRSLTTSNNKERRSFYFNSSSSWWRQYGGYYYSKIGIKCYTINWRAFICAVTLFVWDRERITNTEIERCYNRYKRQYLTDNNKNEEGDEKRCPAIIPSHEVSTNSIEGAFIEQLDEKNKNGNRIFSNSSHYNLKRSNEESGREDDSNERLNKSSSFTTAHTTNNSAHTTNDSAPDDVINISVIKEAKDNNNYGILVLSKLNSGYTYIKSFFTKTEKESRNKMDETLRIKLQPIPLEVTEVVSEDETILGEEDYHLLNTTNNTAYYNRSSSSTSTNTTSYYNSSNNIKSNSASNNQSTTSQMAITEGASDEIIESPWKAVKGTGTSPEEDIKKDGWEFMLEQGTCKVYYKPYNDTGLCQYRVIGYYDDITARDFLDVQTDNEYRKVWDTYAIKLDTIDTDSKTGTEVIYWLLKYPFPMSSRDYVFVRRAWISSNDDAIVIISRSIEHPSLPENKKYVRVKSYFSQMVIKPNSFVDELGFHYDLTYFDDPGTYMPSSAVSWVSKSAMPDFLNKMHTAALRKPTSSYSSQQQHKGAV